MLPSLIKYLVSRTAYEETTAWHYV